MRKSLLLILLVLLLVPSLQARGRRGLIVRNDGSSEAITISFGPAFCMGDSKGSPFNQSLLNGLQNYDFSVGFRHKFPNNFGYKASLRYGDYLGLDEGGKRGFFPDSKVIGLSAQGEYSLLFGPRSKRIQSNTAYAFLGLGVVNSSIKFTGTVGGAYTPKTNSTTPIIPLGFGYQRRLNKQFSMGIEFWYQYVFSDYIDGFSHLTYSKSNDVLEGISLTFSYKIR